MKRMALIGALLLAPVVGYASTVVDDQNRNGHGLDTVWSNAPAATDSAFGLRGNDRSRGITAVRERSDVTHTQGPPDFALSRIQRGGGNYEVYLVSESGQQASAQIPPVPLPGSAPLLLLGLAGMAILRRRSRA